MLLELLAYFLLAIFFVSCMYDSDFRMTHILDELSLLDELRCVHTLRSRYMNS
jgi:hypothetical protein